MSPSGTSAAVISLLALGLAEARAVEPVPPPSLSEIPATFTPKTDSFDYVRRDEMVAMRDGVKLQDDRADPEGREGRADAARRARPYNAARAHVRAPRARASSSVVPQMNDTAVAAGYIVAYQDVRGKHGSEGDYVMTRRCAGRSNPTDVDHATDMLRHDRMAGEEHPGEQRPRRHDRRLLRGLHGGDVDRASASGAEGRPCRSRRWSTAGWATTGSTTAHSAATARSSSSTTSRRRAGATEKWWSDAYDTYDACLRAGSAGSIAAVARPRASRASGAQLAAAPGLRRVVAGAGDRQACSRRNRSACR